MTVGEALSLHDLNPIAHPTFEQVRAAFAAPALALTSQREFFEFGHLGDVIEKAARLGLIVDAGLLPDGAIRKAGLHGAELTHAGVVGHPWGDRPWLLTHEWEPDHLTLRDMRKAGVDVTDAVRERVKGTRERNLYLIEPIRFRPFGMKVTELCLLRTSGGALVLIPAVRVELRHEDPKRYRTLLTPGFVSGASPSASANSALNPAMAAIALMATRGVRAKEMAAPRDVNRRRERKGKAPLPGYVRLEAAEYVTAISAPRGEAQRGDRTPKGGTPKAPHLRRGHPRTYQDGRTVWVRDTLVNVASEGELAFMERRRAAYRLDGGD